MTFFKYMFKSYNSVLTVMFNCPVHTIVIEHSHFKRYGYGSLYIASLPYSPTLHKKKKTLLIHALISSVLLIARLLGSSYQSYKLVFI